MLRFSPVQPPDRRPDLRPHPFFFWFVLIARNVHLFAWHVAYVWREGSLLLYLFIFPVGRWNDSTSFLCNLVVPFRARNDYSPYGTTVVELLLLYESSVHRYGMT